VIGESIAVDLRPSPKPGKVKAYADVTVPMPGGCIRIHGFSVVQLDGKRPFVGMPSRPGSSPGKFFPIVELEGAALEAITTAILEAYDGVLSAYERSRSL
jgi:DNA-binding cell septation regulator SpoVG